MTKPNILLIMTDQFRFDALGYAGHPDVKTPYLDSLAASGVVFNNAYAAVPSCIASRCALMTGLKQEHHGRVGYEDNVRWDYEHTLPGELAKNGYYTKCVGKMHVHPLRKTLGFHDVVLHDGYLHAARYSNVSSDENQKVADDYYYELKKRHGIDTDTTDNGLDCNSFLTGAWAYEEKLHPSNWVTDNAIDFLRKRDKDMPFFLMASYLKPHPPFDPPKEYLDLYMNKKLREPFIGNWEGDSYKKEVFKFDGKVLGDDKELIHQMMAGYYACITHLDRQIGRLIMALREYQLDKNTLIIFTSDHGEELGDHHYFRKSRPYEGSTHIPFMISNLEAIGMQNIKKQHINTPLEVMDIMPTILDAAGITCNELDGKSLLPVIKGEEESIRDYVHGEHSYGLDSSHWIVTEKDKYIWFTETGKEQYFNLAEDPHELNDMIDNTGSQERIKELRGILIQELNGREEGFTDGHILICKRDYPPTLSFLKNK